MNSRLKALIVEDDPASQIYFRDTLDVLGWTTDVADDGVKGVEQFKSLQPDLVLLDINLPRMNGIQVLENIRSLNDDAIVIIVTAHGSEEHAVQALRLRANNYLSKPVNHNFLVSLLKKYQETVGLNKDSFHWAGTILKKNLTLKFPPAQGIASKAARQLIDEVSGILDKTTQSRICLGLSEILANAVEFGCLGITEKDKIIAYRDGHEAYQTLLEDRMKQAVMEEKEVIVDFILDDEKMEWTILDGGNGFDWKVVMRQGQSGVVPEEQGRGIYLSKFAFDQLEYLGNGNIVRATKYRNS